MSIPESRKIKGSTADFQEDLPKDEVFTFETLMRWDGLERPMCIGVCGKVHDVSSSENFEPEMGYGKLWGGKDATHALATASLADDAANNLNWSLEGLEEEHRESLKSWRAHFTGKYPVVGTLNEYAGWDFGPMGTPAAEADATGASRSEPSGPDGTPAAAADATGAQHPVQTTEEAGDAGN